MAKAGAGQDLYAILGVERGADEESIRKIYRQLARRYHPDVNPGDTAAEDKFKEISHAYDVLSDPAKRRNYDEFGEVSLQGGFDAEKARRAREAFSARFGAEGRQAPEGFEGRAGDEAFHFEGVDDLFSDLFARRGWGSPARERRGRDLEAEIELEFMDAARGGEHRVSIARPTADGSLRQESVTVRIPPGVSDGGRIRLRGKGAEGRGGSPPGDLYARVRVRPHRFFRREGRDLHLDLPVTVAEATLGARVEVPTLDGRVTLTIPPGTDSGARLRLRGKGVPQPSGGPPGDLYVVVQIRVPRDLPPDAAAKLRELAPFDPPDPRKELS
jgi:DnaJ-class molecular chaperone